MKKFSKIAVFITCALIAMLSLFAFAGCNGVRGSVDSEKVLYLGENDQFKALKNRRARTSRSCCLPIYSFGPIRRTIKKYSR